MVVEQIFINLATQVTEFCTVAPHIFIIIIVSAMLAHKYVCRLPWSEQKAPDNHEVHSSLQKLWVLSFVAFFILLPFWNLEFGGGCLSFWKFVESFFIPCYVLLVNRIVSNRQNGKTICRYANCRQHCLITAVTKRVYWSTSER
jgi:hypothetical protein